MKTYPRVYTEIFREHLAENRQMAFVSGPRQVGKTTVCRELASAYINWDDQDSRDKVLKGPAEVAQVAGLQKVQAKTPVLVFDELHRYPRWKTFLKGFLTFIRDKQKREVDFLVTQDNRPWFLVEVKNAETHLAPALALMQAQTGAKHAFQVVIEEPYVEADCFRYKEPVVVPARTFLSQLI